LLIRLPHQFKDFLPVFKPCGFRAAAYVDAVRFEARRLRDIAEVYASGEKPGNSASESLKQRPVKGFACSARTAVKEQIIRSGTRSRRIGQSLGPECLDNRRGAPAFQFGYVVLVFGSVELRKPNRPVPVQPDNVLNRRIHEYPDRRNPGLEPVPQTRRLRRPNLPAAPGENKTDIVRFSLIHKGYIFRTEKPANLNFRHLVSGIPVFLNFVNYFSFLIFLKFFKKSVFFLKRFF
jgi:hypothetical protein